MDIAEFKTIVAGYANRDLDSFVQGSPSVDLLLRAINNAKKWAQRKMDFELAREQVTLTVDAVSGGLLTSAVLASDGETPVTINRIERAYLGYNSGTSYRPVKMLSKEAYARRTAAAWNGVEANPNAANFPTRLAVIEPAVVRQGNTVFLFPIPTEATAGTDIYLAFDAFKWMPDYDNSTVTTDFFLEHCSDWLLYRSLRELNFFLKDGQRTQVTEEMVTEAWESVVEWNGSLNNFTDDASLD